RPPGVDRRQGAAKRAACGGGPLRGDLHVRRPRPPEDEVPPLPPQEDEHQALPRPHPLPRPRQDPLAHHPRYDSAQDREGRGRARQAQGVRGRAAAVRQDQAHGHPRRAQRVLRLQPGHRYCLLGQLSKEVGWNYADTIRELEEKRKEKAKVSYDRRKQLAKLRVKAEKAAEEKLGTQLEILAPIKY
uniref:60S ribosomal protein L13a n=1 Tax=Aegilops tauschii subsp. strangulata TaxID=200361 RepID=A0A453LUQ2_AEGTS